MTDPTFLLALAAVVLAAASMVLHVVAPRTKNTIDDRLRDDIDEVLTFIRGRGTSTTSTITKLGPIAVLALFAFALGLAGAACTPTQRTEAGHAVVDCTAANAAAIAGLATSMRAPVADGGCLTATGTDWSCVRSKAIAAGVMTGGCAFVELVSAEATPAARVSSATGEPPPERPGRTAFESYRASVAGGAAFRTAAGDR